jgi:hypothetical protein
MTTTAHPPAVGEFAVARRHHPAAQHITGETASLCGMWDRRKLTVPGPTSRWAELPLCKSCQRAKEGMTIS